MVTYYLDIETNGLDPYQDKIITIQYAELERGTGKQLGELVVLKEWELGGEEEMLKQFIEKSPITNKYGFDFIPVGYNLGFEHNFLLARSSKYNLFPIEILSRPCIDLRSIGIMMNKGEFRGSSLDKITGKSHSGMPIIHWYQTQNYSEIENYIENETKAFVNWYVWLHQQMPELRIKWESELNSKKS